jgi:hypothetical protein
MTPTRRLGKGALVAAFETFATLWEWLIVYQCLLNSFGISYCEAAEPMSTITGRGASGSEHTRGGTRHYKIKNLCNIHDGW